MKHLIISIICLALLPQLYAQKENKWIRQGNKDFASGHYDAAEIAYRKALDNNAHNAKAQFNLGDALYSKKDYAKAAESFAAIGQMKEVSGVDKSQMYYNYGNALLKDNKLDESIAAYKQSLLHNPHNKEARYNLQYAMLKKQEQQKKQQQNKDDQDKKDQNKDQKDKNKQDQKNQQDKNKDQQDKNDQDKQDQKDKNKGQQDKDQKKDQDKQGQQEQSDAQKDKKPQGDNNNNAPSQRQKQKISKQDAEKMLQALKNNEKKTLEKLKKAKGKASQSVKSEKDW